MEEIIGFLILGSLFGIDNCRIAAEEVSVTINPVAKTIIIEQDNLFSIIKSEKDSVAISKELEKMYKGKWLREIETYTSKTLEFSADENNSLHAKVTLHYNNFRDLKKFGITVSSEGKYQLVNIPTFNIKTESGQLNKEHWEFDANKPFTFTQVFKDLPEEYLAHKKSIYTVWKATEKE
ncbi:hypothetical protein [Maribacter sp.]|uniref:hypothetical protein n=1 Tax=Maribacter sp. TaxID=1897614 RepID=UPI0025C4BA45|nr:hypothetical protein [Maribacter sp.]